MLTLRSPAKINLFLRILSKRVDGYHSLASLFQAIDLADEITFTPSHTSRDHLTCTDPSIPTDPKNLILKAAHLFRRKTGFKQYFNIHLSKKIPAEAGLGGGSSNAATTLWACNQLSGSPATIENLLTWSSEIGSDIPFFLSEGTAYCTGRGEIVQNLSPLQLPSERKMWIIKPAFGCATKDVYANLKLVSLPPRDVEEELKSSLAGNPAYFNDLEEAAFTVNPALKNFKQELLSSGFETVLLSGSGSSFFCIGKNAPPTLANTKAFQVNFTSRKQNSWYL